MSETTATTPAATPAQPESWIPEAYRADPGVTKYSSIDALIKGYKDTAAFVGAPPERIARLPEKDDDPAWSGVYAKLGRPDTVEGYGIQADGPDAALWAQALPELHKAGLSKKQMEVAHGLIEKLSGGMQEAYSKDPVQASEGFLARAAEFVTNPAFTEMVEVNLKKAWGEGFDDKMHAANRIAGKYASTDPEIEKLFLPPAKGGYGLSNLPGFVKLMAAMGADVAEPAGLEGVGTSGAQQTAQSALETLKLDATFMQQVRAGDPAAKAKWNAAIVAAHGAV